jgi:hypothetical protein
MNYVEWLRVRNALRIYAIVLGALIVLCLIVRISVNGELSGNDFIVSHIEHDPGTVVSHSVVNGLNRTTLVNAKDRTTITIDDQNNGGKLIHVVEPAEKHARDSGHDSVGAFSYDRSTKNGMDSITFNTNAPINFEIFIGIASIAALVFATIWGCSFASEQGHFEYALLKPVTRVRYALGIIGYDVLGMAIVGAMSILAAIICMSMFELPHFNFSNVAGPATAFLILLPLAWYAALNAATASLRRGSGAVIGFAWPVGLVITALAEVQLPDTPVAHVLHTIFWTVSRFIPITYLGGNLSNTLNESGQSLTIRIATLIGLTLIYGALTLVQWRRVEA